MTYASRRARSQRSRGAVTVEYAILVGFVVALGLGAWTFLGQRIKCALGFAADQLSADGAGQSLCSNVPGSVSGGSGAPPSGTPARRVAAP